MEKNDKKETYHYTDRENGKKKKEKERREYRRKTGSKKKKNNGKEESPRNGNIEETTEKDERERHKNKNSWKQAIHKRRTPQKATISKDEKCSNGNEFLIYKTGKKENHVQERGDNIWDKNATNVRRKI